MREKLFKRICVAVFCVALLCALILCGGRVAMESGHRRLTVIMTEEAAAQVRDVPGMIQLFDGGDRLPDGTWLLVEDENQYSYAPDPAIDRLLAETQPGTAEAACVRCFHLMGPIAARYHYLGYPAAEEIENLLYRAITDRNIRVLWLEPFVDGETGEVVTDGAAYQTMLDDLAARIARHGLSFGSEVASFPAFEPNTLLLLLTAFGVAAGGVWLLTCAFDLKEKWGLPLLILACGACAALLLLRRSLAIELFALAASVIFPCLALQLAVQKQRAAQHAAIGREMAGFAGCFFLCFAVAFAGGLLVAALQSSTRYLLAIDNFRGVKLSQAVPLLFAVYVVLRRLCPIREILQGKKYILVLVVLVLLAGLTLFLMRTGDGMLSAGVIEQRFRNWLERVLLVRPRTKEFLVAWPCFGVAFALCARGAKRVCWPFAILTAPGFSSVVNTFCHSRAPVWTSVVRSLMGALIGMAIGLICIALLHRAENKNKRSIDKI